MDEQKTTRWMHVKSGYRRNCDYCAKKIYEYEIDIIIQKGTETGGPGFVFCSKECEKKMAELLQGIKKMEMMNK